MCATEKKWREKKKKNGLFFTSSPLSSVSLSFCPSLRRTRVHVRKEVHAHALHTLEEIDSDWRMWDAKAGPTRRP